MGAYGAHPLNTEDTGVQGKGRWQLEVNGERNEDKVDGGKVRGSQASAVLSHGVADSVDLQVGLPWQDNGTDRGPGDVFAALKWRFRGSDEQGFSYGLRAGIAAPTGDETRGLGNGRPTAAALLIGQYAGERWTFLAHLGYRHNRNTLDQRESLGEISAAVLYLVVKDKFKLLLDASQTTNPDRGSNTPLRDTVLGAIYSLSQDLDLDVGVRRGNEPAIDRAFMLGMTLRWGLRP